MKEMEFFVINVHHMKNKMRWGVLFCLWMLSLLTIFSKSPAQAASPEEKLSAFRDGIPGIAEKYIGMPYAFGADPDHQGKADNSHLLCAIYNEASQKAGLSFPGYMPMRVLLSHAVKVAPGELRSGDLMVLNDGQAAMIYRVKNPEHFDLIYASLKRGEVISFSSHNLVYEVYWLENLDGFYRIDPELLTSPD